MEDTDTATLHIMPTIMAIVDKPVFKGPPAVTAPVDRFQRHLSSFEELGTGFGGSSCSCDKLSGVGGSYSVVDDRNL